MKNQRCHRLIVVVKADALGLQERVLKLRQVFEVVLPACRLDPFLVDGHGIVRAL